MPIYYPDILEEAIAPQSFEYSQKDAILYALSVGYGEDPLNAEELRFVYESNLKVLPTAVTVLAEVASGIAPGIGPFALKEGLRRSTITPHLVVHGEQKVEIFKPLPARGAFTVTTRNTGAWDKGEGKGALLQMEVIWTDAAGDKVAVSTMGVFCRGDGGFGGPNDAPTPHKVPERAPDKTVDITTRPGQALLYRLNGDRNPLHADPAFAKLAGFPAPILHGLCTYGITCRAVTAAYLDQDPARIRSHQARFSSPVFPGETLSIDLWQDGDQISFEARVKDRGVTVIKNGLTVLG